MIAASAVIVCHSFPIANGIGTWEPEWRGCGLGGAAVQVFFAVSGFFILKSFENRHSFGMFALARVARIVPAFLVVWVAMISLLVAGITFANNPFPFTQNGSLWTIRYEVGCYAMMAVAGLCGLYRNGRFPAFLLAYGMFYLAIRLQFLPVPGAIYLLSLPFVMGMAAYHYRRHVPLHGGIAVALIVAASISTADYWWAAALSFTALWFGGSMPILHTYNRLGDYSYGTYIYAFPTQQLLAFAIPGISVLGMISLALPIVWTLGALSWRFVEKPALDLADAVKTELRSRDEVPAVQRHGNRGYRRRIRPITGDITNEAASG